jgi:hypothetical protein
MGESNYYLLSSLPSLADLSGPPPLTCRDLLEHVSPSPAPEALVKTLFLSDDLLQRDALLAGEIDEAEPAVLTIAQMSDQEPLPDCLSGASDEAPRRIAVDAIWEAYFRHAADVAKRLDSAFLARWTAHEVALRNAVAAARAGALGLEASDYLVAVDLSADDDLSVVTAEWAAATSPLVGLRTLDTARWRWIGEHDAWFSFGNDELAAYAAKLMLLVRWERLTEAARKAGQAVT